MEISGRAAGNPVGVAATATRPPVAGTATRPPIAGTPGGALEGAAPSAPALLRRKPAHPPVCEHHNQPTIVFLTVCTAGRKSILARDDAVKVMRDAWAKARFWRVGRWVIMPDHLHLFCLPATNPPEPLAKWVGFWKSQASRGWPRPHEHPIWQRDFWDTQLRPNDHYGRKWEYVRQNPVRAGLVATPDDWQFQGEENVLMWVG